MLKEIPLFGLGLQGKSPNVTANKLVNCYYEFQREKDRTEVAIHGIPGYTLFTDAGDTPWRGLREFPKTSLLYGVHRGTFYQVDNTGTRTARGTIGTTTGRVDIHDDGRYIVVVDGEEIYTYDTTTPATPIAAVADAERPTSPNTVTFQGARILTDEDGTGQFKGGDNANPLSWNATNVATAESNPDNLVRIFNYIGAVVLAGDDTTEFWNNIGGGGFPYGRILNANWEYGMAARWSLAKFMGTYAFLAKNREGEVIVIKITGYAPERISNFELEHIINGYSSVSDATAYGFTLGGHPMLQLNFPTAGTSWLYDGSTDYWSELRFCSGRHRAEIGTEFLNKTIVSDYENGNLYKLDTDALDFNGEPIIYELTGKHIYFDRKTVGIASLELGVEAGVGTSGQGENPVAALQLAKDAGHSFGNKIFAPMGKTGEYTRRCLWRRLGKGRDIVPRITISDPVKLALTNATLRINEGLY